MGLLDYYRQFEGMSEEEVNAGLREEAAERRRKALTRLDTLDLSHTTWPELPHPRIVNAITYVARRGLNSYPHLRGTDLRTRLAEGHGVDPSRLILGNGAAELLSSATRALLAPGQQLLTLWPSYPLYPLMARRAHGQAVRVEGGIDGLLEAARAPDVRAIALASPNDPTGELLAQEELERLLERPARRAWRSCWTRRWSTSPTLSRRTRPWRCSSATLDCWSSGASRRPGDSRA